MGSIFNLYRIGCRLGAADGMAGHRRRADRELWLMRPVWIRKALPWDMQKAMAKACVSPFGTNSS